VSPLVSLLPHAAIALTTATHVTSPPNVRCMLISVPSFDPQPVRLPWGL